MTNTEYEKEKETEEISIFQSESTDNEQTLKPIEEYESKYNKGNNVTDVFDLYDLVTTVHSVNVPMTRDFMLSDLSDIQRRFIREEMLVAQALKEYIKDKNEAKNTELLILRDILNLTNLTRSKDGRIIKSILSFGQTEGNKPEEEKNVLQKVLGGMFGKEKKQEAE